MYVCASVICELVVPQYLYLTVHIGYCEPLHGVCQRLHIYRSTVDGRGDNGCFKSKAMTSNESLVIKEQFNALKRGKEKLGEGH